MRITPKNITELAVNEVFTYGANRAGRHGRGAAKLAHQKFGAIYGKDGFAGQSYGISTKDENIQTLSLEEIGKEVEKFLDFARRHPKLKFLVTAVGTGLAGYSAAEIAPRFFAHKIPNNVSLPQEFWDQQNA